MAPSTPSAATARICATRQAAHLLRGVLDPAARARGFAEASIFAEWPAIVGPSLAGRCRPLEVRFPRGRRGGGILTLETQGGAALELQHAIPQILERINRYFGSATARGLRFVPVCAPPPTPQPPQPPITVDVGPEMADLEARLGLTEAPDLRDALRELGRAVLVRRAAGLAGRSRLV